MDAAKKKPVRQALGRGLSALISGVAVPVSPPPGIGDNLKLASALGATEQRETTNPISNSEQEGIAYVPISSIHPNPSQPRQEFSERELEELTKSIKTLGVLQPVLVRRLQSGDGYQIVAGERRFRAATRAGLQQLPVIIRFFDDKQALQIALVENVQRESLNPMEEAAAYHRLSEDFSLSQKEIAEQVGKDRATVANFIRLLSLPSLVQEHLKDGRITMGHAKAILTLREPSAQISLAKKVTEEGLSVRALEEIVSRVVVLDAGRPGIHRSATHARSQMSAFPEAVDRIRAALGTKVNIRHHRSGKGKIEVEYFSEAELDRLVEKICS